jgi:hypothetical protein
MKSRITYTEKLRNVTAVMDGDIQAQKIIRNVHFVAVLDISKFLRRFSHDTGTDNNLPPREGRGGIYHDAGYTWE